MPSLNVSYYREEEREGFTIPSFMKHAWAAQLEMLLKVDSICKEHNIDYFADWGTLLGTIRHKGYIPWDDDIDLCMRRHDIDRFRKVIKEYEGIQLLNCYDNPEHLLHAYRVTNSTQFTYNRHQYKMFHGFPLPVGIDIFTLDYCPREKQLEKEMVEAVQVCSVCVSDREWLDEHDSLDKDYNRHYTEYMKNVRWLENACNIKFSTTKPSAQEVAILAEEISGIYTEADSDYLTEIGCLGEGRDYYIPKEYYGKVTYMPFEDVMIPVPNNYDYILRLKYGDDYMTPRNVGAGHGYPFYDGFIKTFQEDQGYETFEDAFDFVQSVSSKYYIDFLTKTNETILNMSEEQLQDEEVDGIKITSSAKHLFAARCEVLEEFKRICQLTNISYYAIGDTIRDIVDGKNSDIYSGNIHVAIMRTDYDRLLKALAKELSPWYDYSSLSIHDNHDDMKLFIYSDSFMCSSEEFAERFYGCTEKVSIDVSVIDSVLEEKSREETRRALIKNLIVTSQSMPSEPSYSDEILRIADEWSKILDVDIDVNGNLRHEFLMLADALAGMVRDDRTSKVRITAEFQEGIDYTYNRSDFDESIEVPFGFTTISVPKGFVEE